MQYSSVITLALLVIVTIEVSYMLYTMRVKEVRKTKQSIFVDTSVLIDGRILSIAEAGFIPGELVIPRSVVGELQLLADGGDHEKRARARHGLDVVRQLQSVDGISVRILQDGSRAAEGVDERLLSLAKKYHGSVCTIDYNLNKVAQVENVTILNINELAKTVRMAYLPGEVRALELVQIGQDKHQGVGYLEDGTMVVVENAAKFVGKSPEVEFIRALQTDAGKMMFARLAKAPQQRQNGASSAKKPYTQAQAAPAQQSNPKQPAQTIRSDEKQTTVKPKGRQPSHRSAKPQQRRSNGPNVEDSLMNLINKQ